MKATEIIDHMIHYVEVDSDTYEDEDGGHVHNQYDFTAARKAVEEEYPNLGNDLLNAIFEIGKRYVGVTWKRHHEENGICLEPEIYISPRADAEVEALLARPEFYGRRSLRLLDHNLKRRT